MLSVAGRVPDVGRTDSQLPVLVGEAVKLPTPVTGRL
jgi:hypothetical protein